MSRFVELLLLLALVLLLVYVVQARDTDGDGVLDAGKDILNRRLRITGNVPPLIILKTINQKKIVSSSTIYVRI
jgi:hypothetical protein